MLTPEAPVKEGKKVDVKLVEVGLYDSGAGVGKLDGYEIVVSGAAKLVGKKVQATVGRVLDGVAFAVVADEAALPNPITFEAEAEKPTRAPAARKTEAAKPVAAEKPAAEKPLRRSQSRPEPAIERGPPERELGGSRSHRGAREEEAAEVAEAATTADGQPKKKRTRRGTRGGRGRKKTPATATATATAEDAAVEVEDGRKPRPPRIHVPAPDIAIEDEQTLVAAEQTEDAETESEADTAAAVDGQPAKKRTRRGSRGGRKRRKPAAADGGSDANDATSAPETAEAAVAEPLATAEAEPAEYVPMSEWIEDFDRRTRT